MEWYQGDELMIVRFQRQLFARSDRVKGIDFHPTEPWVLSTLYSGMSQWICGREVTDCFDTFKVMSIFGLMRLKRW